MMRHEDLWRSRVGLLLFFVTLALLVMEPGLPALWVLGLGLAFWLSFELGLTLYAVRVAGGRAARRVYRDGWSLWLHARRERRRFPHRLDAAATAELQAAETSLGEALAARQVEAAAAALRILDETSSRHFAFARSGVAREYAEIIGAAIFLAVMLRGFVVEAFHIPTGSMIPTLEIGDHIFVNKFIYGLRLPFTDWTLFTLRAPRRGEVVVFEDPTNPEKDLIKRVIGLPGDSIEIISDQIFLNGEKLPREEIGTAEWTEHSDLTNREEVYVGRRYRETLGGLSYEVRYDLNLSNEAPITVPEGDIFVMGDNRDNSQDSRYFGTVSVEKVKGRALFVWWNSAGEVLDRVGTQVR